MRALIQRATSANVAPDRQIIGKIGTGLLILVNDGPVTIWMDT